jgi:hypothetical protein
MTRPLSQLEATAHQRIRLVENHGLDESRDSRQSSAESPVEKERLLAMQNLVR